MLDDPPENVLRKGRLQPGRLFLVDLEQRPHRRRPRDQARDRDAASRTREWFDEQRRPPRPTCPSAGRAPPRAEPLRPRQLAFGYTQEDLKVILAPARAERRGADRLDGQRLALAVLSDQQPLLYSYFKQLFAQVTNPPIDSTREAIVMSVADERRLGAEPARRDARARAAARDRRSRSCATAELEQPAPGATRRSSRRTRSTSPGRVSEGAAGHGAALERISREADEALADGANILILSDRDRRRRPRADPGAPRRLGRAPPPRARGHAPAGRPRGRVGRAARACTTSRRLIGYGAAAVNPYLMLETLARARRPTAGCPRG